MKLSPCRTLQNIIQTQKNESCQLNPLTPTAIQKLLEIIDRVRLYPSCSSATALDSDINQTNGSGGHLSMWKNRCMHAAVCLLRAGQPRSADDAAKLGQFVGKFSWVTGDPIGVRGLTNYSHPFLHGDFHPTGPYPHSQNRKLDRSLTVIPWTTTYGPRHIRGGNLSFLWRHNHVFERNLFHHSSVDLDL